MNVTIEIPEEAGEVLRHVFGEDLSRTALEAMVVEGYRSGRLSRFEAQKVLGFETRWETEDWLAARGLNLNYSLGDLEADRRTLEDLLGPVKS